MEKYAVVVSWECTNAEVYLFNEYKAACDYMYQLWKACYETERLKDSVVGLRTEHRRDYATISWEYEDIDTEKVFQVVRTKEAIGVE